MKHLERSVHDIIRTCHVSNIKPNFNLFRKAHVAATAQHTSPFTPRDGVPTVWAAPMRSRSSSVPRNLEDESLESKCWQFNSEQFKIIHSSSFMVHFPVGYSCRVCLILDLETHQIIHVRNGICHVCIVPHGCNPHCTITICTELRQTIFWDTHVDLFHSAVQVFISARCCTAIFMCSVFFMVTYHWYVKAYKYECTNKTHLLDDTGFRGVKTPRHPFQSDIHTEELHQHKVYHLHRCILRAPLLLRLVQQSTLPVPWIFMDFYGCLVEPTVTWFFGDIAVVYARLCQFGNMREASIWRGTSISVIVI